MEHFLGGQRSERPFRGGQKEKKNILFARVHDFSAFGFFVLFCLFVICMEGWQSLEIHQAVFGRIRFCTLGTSFVLWSLEYIHDRYH